MLNKSSTSEINKLKYDKYKNIKSWYVGGCVRDYFIGIKPKDIDIAIEGLDHIESLLAYLSEEGAKIYTVKEEFLTPLG